MDMPKLSFFMARKRAAAILARIMIGPDFKLEPLPSISSNSVFLASDRQPKLVIRIGAADAYYRFRQAAQAMQAAKKAGVPVAKVVLTGRELVPCAYQITEYLEGSDGDKYPVDKLRIWRQIGAAAAKINQVHTSGLEYDLFPRLDSVSWQAFINQKLDQLVKFWPEFRHWKSRKSEPFFTRSELAVIFQAMETLRTYEATERSLIHIDLAPRNVLVNNKGRLVGVLDWDGAKSFPPAHQVATTTFWLGPAEEKAFLKGYKRQFDPRLVLAFQLYEYLTQIPFKPLPIAETARDIILWKLSLRPIPNALAGASPSMAVI
jgi:aminoglycoside phosphotransferase (APT) family kinase protein